MPNERLRTMVLYDGVCGLCNRLIQFLLARDRLARLCFAPLQSPVALRICDRHQRYSRSLDTIYVVAQWDTPQEQLLSRSRAVLYLLSELGGGWKLFAMFADVVPTPLADAVYRLIATHRYGIFGTVPYCTIPSADGRERFLDPKQPPVRRAEGENAQRF